MISSLQPFRNRPKTLWGVSHAGRWGPPLMSLVMVTLSHVIAVAPTELYR